MNKDAVNRRLRRAREAAEARRKRRGGVHEVVNPAGLADEIRTRVELEHEGVVSLAAKRIGLSQPTLSALVRGSRRRVSAATVRRLNRLFGSESEWVRRYVYDPTTLQRIDEYHRWNRALSERRSGVFSKLVPGSYTPATLARDYVELLRRVDRLCPEVVSGLRALQGTTRYLPERLALAMWRIVDPLYCYQVSGGAERHHSELTDDEFKDFVSAGFKREKILLHRDADIERLQRYPEFGVGNGRRLKGVGEVIRELLTLTGERTSRR